MKTASIRIVWALALGVLALTATTSLARAALYFDAAGGAKPWDGTANWAGTPSGTYDQPWVDDSDAVFEGATDTGNIVNVDGTHSVNSVTFNTNGYTLSGGTLNMAGGSNMNGTGFIAGSGVAATIGSTITGLPNFVKLGTGTVTLTGFNTYTGGTDLNEGTLSVSTISDDGDSNIGHNYLAVNYGATLQFTGADTTTSRALWIDRSAGYLGGPNAEGATFDISANGSLTFNGGGSVAKNITKTGWGTLGMGVAISGNAAVAVNQGWLKLTADNSYSGGTTITGGVDLGNGGTSGTLGSGAVAFQDTGVPANPAVLHFTRSDSYTIANTITGNGVVRKYGDGVLTLTGNNTYTAGTNIETGTLSVAKVSDTGDSNIGNSGYLAIVNGATFQYTGTENASTSRVLWIDRGAGGVFDVTEASATLTLNPTGGGACTANITKVGAGTLVMNGTIDGYANVAVNNGKLLLNAANTYSGTTTVNAGTLGGTGTINGQVTIADLARLAPGASIGTLTINNSLTLASGSKFDFELAGVDASDKVSMASSTLYLNGQQFSDFAFTTQAGFGKGTYVLFDAGTIDGSLASSGLSGTVGGLGATLGIVGNDVILTVVPEPSAIMLLAASLVSLLAYAWRKRK